MKHYIPLQSASLWTETESTAPAQKSHWSSLTMAAAVLTVVAPLTLAYIAWHPNSALYSDTMHWVEWLRYSIGL